MPDLNVTDIDWIKYKDVNDPTLPENSWIKKVLPTHKVWVPRSQKQLNLLPPFLFFGEHHDSPEQITRYPTEEDAKKNCSVINRFGRKGDKVVVEEMKQVKIDPSWTQIRYITPKLMEILEFIGWDHAIVSEMLRFNKKAEKLINLCEALEKTCSTWYLIKSNQQKEQQKLVKQIDEALQEMGFDYPGKFTAVPTSKEEIGLFTDLLDRTCRDIFGRLIKTTWPDRQDSFITSLELPQKDSLNDHPPLLRRYIIAGSYHLKKGKAGSEQKDAVEKFHRALKESNVSFAILFPRNALKI